MSKHTAVGLSIGAIVLSTIALSHAAYADLQVMSSTVPSLETGTKLPDNAQFNVGQGQEVRLQNVQSGKTYDIAGPYKGSLDDYTKGCSWWRSLLGTCEKRAPEDVSEIPGATRGPHFDAGDTPAAGK